MQDGEDELVLETQDAELDPALEGEEEDTIIAFADETGEETEETPLVKRLRDQLRSLQQQKSKDARTRETDDPEPVVPARPKLEDYDFDSEKHDAAEEAYFAAKESQIEWKARESQRSSDRQRAADEQLKQIEQQKRSLNVSNYDERAAMVASSLSEQQLAILMNAADNPAKVIYALGGSASRLAVLASVDNLAKFAGQVCIAEKEIKMVKGKAPPPESRVTGATATMITSSKELARLEAEADKTGNRSAVIAYKRRIRQAA